MDRGFAQSMRTPRLMLLNLRAFELFRTPRFCGYQQDAGVNWTEGDGLGEERGKTKSSVVYKVRIKPHICSNQTTELRDLGCTKLWSHRNIDIALKLAWVNDIKF